MSSTPTDTRPFRVHADMTYDYTGLDSATNEIRLLTILPSDEATASIECTIEHVSLDQLPSYTALSYHWDDNKHDKSILLNGRIFPISSNLLPALRQLRNRTVRLRIWVDSVCINQNDLSEKGQQILLMGSIFRRARKVNAWIGGDDEDTAQALNLITRLLSEKDVAWSKRNPLNLNLMPLKSLLQREYWQRVWIIQELTLARSITIYCGKYQLPWTKLRDAISVATINMQRSSLNVAELWEWKTVADLNGLLDLRSRITDIRRSQPVQLLYALSVSLKSRSSEPRDKVYGLLGLVSDAANYVARPNYKSPLESINVSITLTYIATKENLDPIVLLGRGCNHDSVVSGQASSWVPLWHALEESGVRRQLEYMIGHYQDGPATWRAAPGRIRPFPYHAARGSTCLPTQESGCLTCPSVYVGRIRMVGGSIFDAEVANHAGSYDDGLRNPYSGKWRHQTKLATFNAIYYNAFCIGGFRYDWLVPPPFGRDLYPLTGLSSESAFYLSEFLRIWRAPSYHAGFKDDTQAWIDTHRTFNVHGLSIQQWARWMTWTFAGMRLRHTSVLHRQGTNQKEFLKPDFAADLAFNIECGQRLMVTDQGYIGWAHHRARKDDSLYILKGCSVPVILRPRAGGGFYVVGDAYVHGLMQGEAIKDTTSEVWRDIQIY
ncbi:MAG: hypothetical protein Q9166_000681 [cf. Caloplaca sp. 2 TL-2023]